MTPAVAQQWLQWWARPWQWADASWTEAIAERHLSDAQFAWLSAVHPDRLGVAFGIEACSPTVPEPVIISLLQASERRDSLLAVVEHLCTARATRQLPDETLRPWCRSVAKALRPGSWLPDEPVDPLQLLAQWRGEAQWQRLKLLWPRGAAYAISASPCAEPKRLDMLWRAALQRVLEEPDVHSPHAQL